MNGEHLALIEKKRIVVSLSEISATPQSVVLLKKINELLHESDLSVEDIGQVLFCNGPGSFTSLRVGLATLMGLFLERGPTHPLSFAVCSSLLLRCLSVPATRPVAAVMRAGRAKIYLGVLSTASKDGFTEKVLSLGDFESWRLAQTEPFTLLGDGLTLLDNISPHENFSVTAKDEIRTDAFLKILESPHDHRILPLAEARLNYLLEPEIG